LVGWGRGAPGKHTGNDTGWGTTDKRRFEALARFVLSARW